MKCVFGRRNRLLSHYCFLCFCVLGVPCKLEVWYSWYWRFWKYQASFCLLPWVEHRLLVALESYTFRIYPKHVCAWTFAWMLHISPTPRHLFFSPLVYRLRLTLRLCMTFSLWNGEVETITKCTHSSSHGELPRINFQSVRQKRVQFFAYVIFFYLNYSF